MSSHQTKQKMSHLRKLWRQTPKTKTRRVHQIQLSHPRRFNAYKVAGYSFGALTAIIVGPIVLWPIADVWLLPKVLSSSLQTEPSAKYKEKYSNIWGRDYEIEQIEYMMKSEPNNIWILSGSTNSGKTALIKKLLSLKKGIIYVDLRHFFDGNAFVFEMVDSLYNANHSNSLINKLVGCYVKLFCFVTAVIAQSDQHITAMLYFHALLNHLKAGITKRNEVDSSNAYPLIVFDHFEALPSALKNTKDTKNREMLQFIIYSISQFSSSICHDLSLSHVLFVGDDFFTMSQTGKDEQQDVTNVRGSLHYLSSSILKHCEYWSVEGINKEVTVKRVIQEFEDKLGISDGEKLQNMVESLIDCIGTKPHNISVALNAVTSHMDSEPNLDALNRNITTYVDHFNESQRLKIRTQLMASERSIGKLQKFTSSLSKSNKDLIEWNEAMEHFESDQELMVKLIDNGILSRKHGKKLSSNLDELMQMKLLGKDDSIYVGTIAECCESLASQI